MKNTKQRILNVSLELFSKYGFSAVSIRDICGQVQIKESTIYYHFKNKQAIFNELLGQFETLSTNMMEQLEKALSEHAHLLEEGFYQKVCNAFFEYYFMDNFCNKVMRMLSI